MSINIYGLLLDLYKYIEFFVPLFASACSASLRAMNIDMLFDLLRLEFRLQPMTHSESGRHASP